jgi:hypothetical protein
MSEDSSMTAGMRSDAADERQDDAPAGFMVINGWECRHSSRIV